MNYMPAAVVFAFALGTGFGVVSDLIGFDLYYCLHGVRHGCALQP